MAENRESLELGKLIIELVDGSINNERLALLDKWLHQSPEALKFYREFMKNIVVLNRRADIYLNGNDDDSNYAFLEYLAEYEKTAPIVEVLEDKTTECVPETHRQKPTYKLKRSSWYSIYAAAAAILLIVLFVRFAPSKGGVEVATLTDSINAKWAGIMMQEGERLKTDGSTLMLREGVAELLFDNHTKVVIEAPSEFELVSKDQINLRYGRIYSVVPKEAIGFSIDTPHARVIDLGTEFGINAEAHGDTSLHVIKGKTVLIAGDRFNKNTVEVVEGFAKKVSPDQKISDVRCDDRLFIRDIQSEKNVVWRGQREFSLSDIVGAGNGLGTGTVENSIDPLTGEMSDWEMAQARAGNGEYVSVSASEYIDGVFVPDGSNGPIVVTSQGDTWGCPETSSFFKYNVVNSLQIPRDLNPYRNYVGDTPKTDVILNKAEQGDVSLKTMSIMSKQYHAGPTDETIFVHANLGITFDLWKIRKILPELTQVKKFQSVFGAGEIALKSQSFDVWVLVDGKAVFDQQDLDSTQILDIEIELTNKDRYLSLVVTEGSDEFSYYNDWGVFINPRLIFE